MDERLIAPETRHEIIDGKVEYVAPSDEAHGRSHSRLSALLEAYAARGYDVASDMLTRTSALGDMAPDASVFPSARDAATGGRRIEELAFEVLSTERLGHAAKKARALHGRGVRRIFAIDVERRRALAWSAKTNTWEILPSDGSIEDPALALTLPVAALVEAGRADDAVAAALLARKNPVIEAAIGDAEKRGVRKGKIEALFAILAGRRIKVGKKAEKRIRAAEDDREIDSWLARAASAGRVEDLFER